MGDLVDLERYRRSGVSRRVAERLAVNGDPAALDPADHGWVVVESGADGRPVRWFHATYIAQIGHVPSAPEWVFLDWADTIRAWQKVGISDLVRALETMTLPEPEVTLRWDGTVVEPEP